MKKAKNFIVALGIYLIAGALIPTALLSMSSVGLLLKFGKKINTQEFALGLQGFFLLVWLLGIWLGMNIFYLLFRKSIKIVETEKIAKIATLFFLFANVVVRLYKFLNNVDTQFSAVFAAIITTFCFYFLSRMYLKRIANFSPSKA